MPADMRAGYSGRENPRIVHEAENQQYEGQRGGDCRLFQDQLKRHSAKRLAIKVIIQHFAPSVSAFKIRPGEQALVGAVRAVPVLTRA